MAQASAGATPLGGGTGRLAFTSERDGNAEIYTMNIDGSGLVRLTCTETEDRSPAWSPDGRFIAFLSRRDGSPDIHVMTAEGTRRISLTTETSFDEFPGWSPDGAGLEPLADHAAADWAPDGRLILFAAGLAGSFDVFVMRADGSDIRQVTADPAEDYAADWQP